MYTDIQSISNKKDKEHQLDVGEHISINDIWWIKKIKQAY